MIKFHKTTLLFFFLLISLAGATEKPEIISIWPEDTKGIRTNIAEKTKSPNDRYYNIFNPTIEVIKPLKPNGMAIIICPGGGYSYTGLCT